MVSLSSKEKSYSIVNQRYWHLPLTKNAKGIFKGHSANWQGNWLRQACYILYCTHPHPGEKEAKQSNFPFCSVHADMQISVKTEWECSGEGECIQLYWQNEFLIEAILAFFSNIISGNEIQSSMTFTPLLYFKNP